MMTLTVRIECDIRGCDSSETMVLRVSEAQLMGRPELIRSALKEALSASGYGVREVGGRREHLCPPCWQEEFVD